eukprot:TRINITY_DN2117_c0_g1_i5.p1 TRINITY_DN2117_c0_g1~~TRINITY_DN2117_c0_g1_i5.p1  ORF type:complete len:303 (+),score=20.47 TRINITY_DN2117_c0_g1_i5:88-996(+)
MPVYCGENATDKDLWYCARALVLGVLALCTSLCCIVVLRRTFLETRRWTSKRMIMLYLAMIQALTACIHYFWLKGPKMAFFLNSIALFFYCSIWYFFATIACGIFKKPSYRNTVARPVLAVLVAYIISILIWALAKPANSITCRDTAWVLFTASHIILTCLFTLVGYFITRKLGQIKVSGTASAKKKTQLWILIIVNFLAALVIGVYEIFNQTIVARNEDCDVYFGDKNAADSVMYLIQRCFSLFVPLWAVLYTMYHWPTKSRQSEIKRSLSTSEDIHVSFTAPNINSHEFRASLLQDPPSP